ncbi:MAG: hypothetical protein Q9174_005015, partial [Haloplaca sp. 1 TL-2023]
MLPGFLQSSYRTYKEDTNAVASWLAVKAKQCGYSADLLTNTDGKSAQSKQPPKSQRLKGKARKEAKQAAQAQGSKAGSSGTQGAAQSGPVYTIGTKDFISLAEYIVAFTKPVVEVPAPLVKVLDRAINLRKGHNESSRDTKTTGKAADQLKSDETHSYFLGILEQTREILRPRMPADTTNDALSQPLADLSIANEATKGASHKTAHNRFDNLELEEPSQQFLDAPGAVRAAGANPKDEPRYEVENLQTQEEKYWAAHCMFQDIRYIRSFLRTLWTSYKDGQIDLVAASITTDTAVDLVRDLERDYTDRFPGTSGYEAISHLFYSVQSLHLGQQPDHRQRPDDPFNFQTYELAEQCMLTTYVILSSLQNAIDPDFALVYKPGACGYRERSTTWSQKSARDKFQDDKLVIMEGFPDLSLFARTTRQETLAEDNFIRGIRDMGPGKEIPLWVIFAGQCFLDTQHVLEADLDRGHKTLVSAAKTIKKSIELNLEFHKSLRVVNWPKEMDAVLREVVKMIDSWVLKDLVADRFQKIKMQTGTPGGEPYSMLRQYPLLCGLFTFAIKTRFQELSITFANAWGSIMYTAHLYNALRFEKLMGTGWKDMEFVISLQSQEALFVGDAPRTLEDYLKRYLLSMGYSATNFASNRRPGASATASSRGPRGMAQLGRVCKLFGDRYCNNTPAVAFTRESIQPIFDSKLDDDDDDDEDEREADQGTSTAIGKKGKENVNRSGTAVKQAKSGTLLRKPKPNPQSESNNNNNSDTRDTISTLDFLSSLTNALHAEQLELSIDYLMFHRICWRLLRKINETCKPKLLEMYGGGYLDKENQLPFIVGYIFMAATTTSRVANNLLLPRRTEEVTSRLLALAGEVMESLAVAPLGQCLMQVLG